MEANESVLRAGYRLDRYELLCPIASGGMATVWLARLRGKRGFEKLFAIKTIRTDLVDDARFQEMFLDEARIACGIQHPNVAQILDLGEQDDVLFIVMEWVDGDSLARVRKLLGRRDTTLPIGIVLRVLSEACGGLHAAHELRDDRGEPLEIVHRDVSPHNILLATSGAVKVIDFGIAKAQNRQQGQTRTGIVKGKIQYMAPEQVKKGCTVDRRADVWALGMCLHELVAGKLPYDGADDVDVIRRLMTDDGPAIAPEIPRAIRQVLERSMVLDPDARFPTAAGMQRALEGAMKELGESASSDDVVMFLRAELPELARRRREAVAKAIDEARERGTPTNTARDEVAFAPTVVGEREAPARDREEARAIALTKRKGLLTSTASAPFSAFDRAPVGAGDAPSAIAGSAEDSRVASSVELEQDPITLPKRPRVWLWGIVALAGVGVGVGLGLVWPDAAAHVLRTFGGRVATEPSAARTSSVGEVPPPGTGDPVVRAPPSLVASPPTRQGETIAAPSAANAQPLPDAAAPRASALRETVSPGAATGEVGAPPPLASAPAWPAPDPPASEDDPNNPYNESPPIAPHGATQP
jgi:serine/threonine-protein kinase